MTDTTSIDIINEAKGDSTNYTILFLEILFYIIACSCILKVTREKNQILKDKFAWYRIVKKEKEKEDGSIIVKIEKIDSETEEGMGKDIIRIKINKEDLPLLKQNIFQGIWLDTMYYELL